MNVFITGVSSGIGWGLAKYYLSEGHKVYGISRRTPADLIGDRNFQFVSGDLSDFDNVEEVLSQLYQGVSKLDLVVLNAGILGEIKDLKDQSISELKEVTNINLWTNKSVVDATLKLVPKVEKVVGISSGAAVNGSRGWGGYSISKAALNMLIKLYAAENPEVKFYAFAPGLIDTSMQDYLCSGKLDTMKFPSAEKLMAARGTEAMPSAEAAGKILAKGMLRLDELESGSFADIRKM